MKIVSNRKLLPTLEKLVKVESPYGETLDLSSKDFYNKNLLTVINFQL